MTREQLRDSLIARFGLDELRASGLRKLVVATARPRVLARFLVGFPVRTDQAQRLEPAQCGVDGPAGQAGDVHDVEPEPMALGEGLQEEETGVGQGPHVRIYIVQYAGPGAKFK